MLDWLHWGGQLILSGPDTLDTLRGSFLAPYLPALSVGACKLGPAELHELNAFSGKPIRPLQPARPWSGIRLQIASAGRIRARRPAKCWPNAAWDAGGSSSPPFACPSASSPTGRGATRSSARCCFAIRRENTSSDSDGEPLLNGPTARNRLDAGRISDLRYFARDAGVPFTTYGADAGRVRAVRTRSPSELRAAA